MRHLKIIRTDRQLTSTWAGGTTTQLYIYPEHSSYSERNFIWRLSTAKVELEESAFTSLEGYDRCLMVLEGELKLVHSGHHSTYLSQFEQDGFKGGWNTVSYGRARDFNLMVKEGCKGALEHIRLPGGASIKKQWKAERHKEFYYGLYCYKGKAVFEEAESEAAVEAGDLLLLASQEQLSCTIKNSHTEECSLIAALIEEYK
jgi:environmental stress-induced protein Ves